MSPRGLGLPVRLSWELTPREFAALERVYEQDLERWALSRAMFANAHMRPDIPYTVDDFMGRGNRQGRAVQETNDKMAVLRANSTLAMMKPGDQPDGLPDWAKGEYLGAK